MARHIHIALDFDSTLAEHESGGDLTIGKPIKPMIEQVKRWVAKGYEITIFTARVSKWFKNGEVRPEDFKERQRQLISQFLAENGLQCMFPVLITADKSPRFTHFVDDKAVKVIPNKGIVITTDENL
jgi:hypothetical protein